LTTTSSVTGIPRVIIRIECAALLILASALYAKTGTSWWLFAILFLAPDVSFLGYLGGPRAGAIVYNAAHTLTGPMLLALAGLFLKVELCVPLALIWCAHIGFDRMLGYGLKYEAGFSFTHLGRIGRIQAPTNS
jgi:hypothetical protein